MGLDDFKSSSSNGGNASTTQNSGNPALNKVEEVSRDRDEDDYRPWFTAVIDKESEEVQCYEKGRAFARGGRHANEKFLICIETEEDFELLNGRCEDLHDCSVKELFMLDPYRAADFIERLDPRKNKDTKVECAVCEEPIIVTQDEYTKVEDSIVHAEHRVDKVVNELDLGP